MARAPRRLDLPRGHHERENEFAELDAHNLEKTMAEDNDTDSCHQAIRAGVQSNAQDVRPNAQFPKAWTKSKRD